MLLSKYTGRRVVPPECVPAARPGSLHQDMQVFNLNANFQCGQGPADGLKAASIPKNKSCAQDTLYRQSMAYINLYSAPLCLMDCWIIPVSICTWCVSSATKRGFPFTLVD